MTATTVIVVADHALINGGQNKVAIESAVGLADRGHSVVYFAAVGPADPRLAEAGIDVRVLGQTDVTRTTSLLRFGVQWLWNQPAASALAQLISSHDPTRTIVHVHGWAKALSPSLGPVLRETSAPVVFTMHEYYLACPNGGFYDYPVSAACHRIPMSGACLTHNCDSRSYLRKLMRVGRHALLQRSGMGESASAIITISDLQRVALTPYLPAHTEFYDIGNPVDIAPLGPKPDGRTGDFVFVGRLSPEKGPLLFAEAARRAGHSAVFVGDGPLRPYIARLYPEAKITGWLPPGEVHERLRAARALVFPSVWYEGQPLTVLESLALGTPVIVSDICAGREAVQHGTNGLWFTSNDADALANAMRVMADDARVAHMSTAAYSGYWADPLTLKRHLDSLESLYETLLSQSSIDTVGPASPAQPRPAPSLTRAA